jgi:hypothetical protein
LSPAQDVLFRGHPYRLVDLLAQVDTSDDRVETWIGLHPFPLVTPVVAVLTLFIGRFPAVVSALRARIELADICEPGIILNDSLQHLGRVFVMLEAH